jgi:hypothetical protein
VEVLSAELARETVGNGKRVIVCVEVNEVLVVDSRDTDPDGID